MERGSGSTFTLKARVHRKNERHEETVLVLDDFDEIKSDAERTQFAEFIKQIGGRNLPIRFVLCGVSEAVKKVFGAHESCYGNPDVAQPNSDAKHYVHFVSERLFWEMFNDPTFARSII